MGTITQIFITFSCIKGQGSMTKYKYEHGYENEMQNKYLSNFGSWHHTLGWTVIVKLFTNIQSIHYIYGKRSINVVSNDICAMQESYW